MRTYFIAECLVYQNEALVKSVNNNDLAWLILASERSGRVIVLETGLKNAKISWAIVSEH